MGPHLYVSRLNFWIYSSPSFDDGPTFNLTDLQPNLSYFQDPITTSIRETFSERQQTNEDADWTFGHMYASPSQTDTWIEFPGVSEIPLLIQPEMSRETPEMLMVRFDKETCGILSVKDGPYENP